MKFHPQNEATHRPRHHLREALRAGRQAKTRRGEPSRILLSLGPMNDAHKDGCVFCDIASGKIAASIAFEDELTMAFVDFRQFHAGHTLVIPRRHLRDVRELDHATGAALMATLSRVTRAVGAIFPNEGLSLWHSIGEAAFQEVPHLHIHIHPRFHDDEVLRVYPNAPATPEKQKRDEYASNLRHFLAKYEEGPNQAIQPTAPRSDA